MTEANINIDGKSFVVETGQSVLQAAVKCGVYIPTLCNFEGLKPAGSCRICTVRINGRFAAACTQPVADGMVIENTAPDVEDMRKAIIEMLFVEGNHFCPICEKSGNCELQALAYRYRMLAPRFPYLFQEKTVDAGPERIYLDRNRCVLCHRCVREFRDKDGRKIFGTVERGLRTTIEIDSKLAPKMSEEDARRAMDMCPVGAIIRKEIGFKVPIGKRKFDHKPIGSDVEEGRGGAK